MVIVLKHGRAQSLVEVRVTKQYIVRCYIVPGLIQSSIKVSQVINGPPQRVSHTSLNTV